MTIQLLIDAIVRQTTVLIAQLATAGGVRAPLAHVANQVFLDLARELEAQGVSQKVSADMFGMALRAYTRKVHRLGESETERGRTLWEAIYDFIGSETVVTRRRIEERFARDEDIVVRGVLHDLTESGLVFASGSGPETMYRAVSEEDLGEMRKLADTRPDELVWVIIYREGPLSRASLETLVPRSKKDLDATIDRLVEMGRIEANSSGHDAVYQTRAVTIPLGAKHGWEAAVLDHFHAVVRTISTKVQHAREATATDSVGGSTYTYAVWPGHPLRDEVVEWLSKFREENDALRERVRQLNEKDGVPPGYEEVVIYGGQCILEQEGNGE